MVRPVAQNLVELRGVGGTTLMVHFGVGKIVQASPELAISRLVSAIVADVPTHIREQSFAFFEQILAGVLRAGHGTLAAVRSARKRTLPTALRDSIPLERALGATELISTLVTERDPNCLANTRLLSLGALISGMLLWDGITVFGSNGTVRAYNIIVKHTDKRFSFPEVQIEPHGRA